MRAFWAARTVMVTVAVSVVSASAVATRVTGPGVTGVGGGVYWTGLAVVLLMVPQDEPEHPVPESAQVTLWSTLLGVTVAVKFSGPAPATKVALAGETRIATGA